jgi:hypothetical protein
MTGYVSGAAMAAGFLAPGMGLITKPFTVQALALRIREMIENTEHGILARRCRQSFNANG